MQVTLSGTWALSTDHAASSYEQPVLVNRPSGDAYGPGDIVQLYPSYGFLPAADGVRRLAKTAKLSADGRLMVATFARVGR